MRSLSPEEAALWARVASTIRPLSREKNPVEATEKQSEIKSAPKQIRTPALPAIAPRLQRSQTLDSTWDRRLSKGSVQPDRVLDLHGMSLDTAWRAIDSGLEQAIERGDRVVLLITGHHRPGEPPVRRGAIRAAVHDWLAASRHADRIAAVRGAHPRHGGGGSLYLILRRAPMRH
ncbi:MAG TPA: Smr/MutS family protein [Sphingomicrobium sp.]|nr:Smr/MutS family protein [Sphingomicrobium sp.]